MIGNKMCVSCGCSEAILHEHNHDQEQQNHKHKDDNLHEHVHHSTKRDDNMVSLETSILSENERFAATNRNFFAKKKVLALNLLSSPGSGKTTLLETTIKQQNGKHKIYVIEGDQHTELDAKRIRNAGADAYQINTGKTCHLDAHMITHALEHLSVAENSIMFIENVGNLICPALFDLGEHVRVVIISVTEGEDKPLKYPGMFRAADLVIINKIDLLPYVPFSIKTCIENIHKINAKIEIIQLSALNQNSVNEWINWLNSTQLYG